MAEQISTLHKPVDKPQEISYTIHLNTKGASHMNTNTAAAVTLLGFLLTFGAVGGMEDPAKEAWFLEQCAVALVGLALMAVGVLGLQNSDHPDQ